jgi:hypothetical protein
MMMMMMMCVLTCNTDAITQAPSLAPPAQRHVTTQRRDVTTHWQQQHDQQCACVAAWLGHVAPTRADVTAHVIGHINHQCVVTTQ